MKLRYLACVAAALGLASSTSFAQTVSDPFGGTAGPVGTTTGGTGFTGGFVGQNPTDVPTAVISPTGLTFGDLATSGGSLTSTGGTPAFRTLATPINTDTGTLFTSFLAAAGGATRPEYAGLSFFSGGLGTEELFLGQPFNAPNFGFDVSGVANGAQTAANAPVSTTPTFLVFRLDFTEAGETISLFRNPTPGGALPATPDATFAIPEGSFADTLTALRFASGNGSEPFIFDEVRLGSTFAQVAPLVPEPAALSFLGAAGLLVLRRRRA